MSEQEYHVPEDVSVPWRDLRDDESVRSGNRDIHITAVKTMAIDGSYPWGIVKVETDADCYGIGETFHGEESLDLVNRVSRHIVGENPLDITRITELLNQRYSGAGGIGQSAFTGIETALWDIKGKVLDAPIYELLGGKYRDELMTYCDTHAGESVGEALASETDEVYTPASYAAAAREVVDEGFDALKFDLDVPVPGRPKGDVAARRLDNEAIQHKVDIIDAVRDEIGYGVDLGVDLHWNFTVETAIRLGKKLEPYDLAFIEDPVPPEKTTAHRRVAQKLDTPILTGENLVRADQFNELAHAGGMSIAAPDVNKCGGLKELQSIARICDLYGIPLAPHNLASPVGLVAGAHVCAAIPNFFSLEFRGRDVPWWNDVVDRAAEPGPILEDGYVSIPDGPGLGIEINRDIAEQYKTDSSDLIFE